MLRARSFFAVEKIRRRFFFFLLVFFAARLAFDASEYHAADISQPTRHAARYDVQRPVGSFCHFFQLPLMPDTPYRHADALRRYAA